MGKPIFVNDGSIGTAAVALDKAGKRILYYWEQSFWDKLDDYERAFVISHESLHVCLNQLQRGKDLKHKKPFNLSADCVVNSILEDDFGFDRDKISFWDTLATFDTVFKDPKWTNLDKDYEFEYYYELLIEDAPEIEVYSIDNHNVSDDDFSSIIDADLGDTISSEERRHAKAGKGEGKKIVPLIKTSSKECRGWMKIIKKWKKDFIDDDDYQWIKPNRRLQELPDDLFLPSMNECETISKKNHIWIFWDISYSCLTMIEPFRQAILSIPKKHISYRCFSFDTKVEPINPHQYEIKAGGGTCFQCIEDELCAAKRYPDFVWVLSDGEAAPINPKYPERWHFFISGPHQTTRFLPQGSHHYLLEDVIAK